MPINIKFSEMYDKLKKRHVGFEWHTYRGYSPQKDNYYKSNIDKISNILVNKNISLGKSMITSLDYSWSNDLSLSFIKDDTYDHYTEDDWVQLMLRFYGHWPIFGIIINLVDTEICRTTQQKLYI